MRCLLQSPADLGQALLPSARCPAAPHLLSGWAGSPAIAGCYVCIIRVLHCPVTFTGRALSSPGPSDRQGWEQTRLATAMTQASLHCRLAIGAGKVRVIFPFSHLTAETGNGDQSQVGAPQEG